jgi:hypothetical protein
MPGGYPTRRRARARAGFRQLARAEHPDVHLAIWQGRTEAERASTRRGARVRVSYWYGNQQPSLEQAEHRASFMCDSRLFHGVHKWISRQAGQAALC